MLPLTADPTECAWRVGLAGSTRGGESRSGASGCDAAKRWLSDRAVRYSLLDGRGPALTSVGADRIEIAADDAPTRQRLDAALDAAGDPRLADPTRIDHLRVVGILFVLAVFVTMAYGPMTALPVEMFPTRVRCTSVSLPYHIGNGWFGGLLPSVAFAIAVQTGNMDSGLWCLIVIALTSCVIDLIFVNETTDVDLDAVR